MPHPIDVQVGTKVRITRAARGITQQQLSEMLSISFQQLQKYEKGSNRISASRLWEIAQALEVDIEYFFEDMKAETRRDIESLSSRSIQLAGQINKIADEAVRNQIVSLIKACSSPAS